MRPQSRRRTWKRSTLAWRVRFIAVALLAAAVVLALVVGMVRLIQWQHQVSTAKDAQAHLEQTYGFNPGNIITDGQMFNAHSMNAAQVQATLNDQGSSCTAANCLKSFTFDTENVAADAQCMAYQGATSETAAAIITKSAQACSISPEVLLTMLQKEQHLLTATNPSDSQYRSAMGLSCPDDAHCDPAYAGFFHQVLGAARRLQYYRDHAQEYGYHAHTLNTVRYSPNPSCGCSRIYIENEATALLYIYTPYQPNAAALAAGGGNGDACSSYGNRNFSLIYRSLFES